MGSSDQAITIQDIGPIQLLKIPIKPGVVKLVGRNDSGKSIGIDTVSKLAGGNGNVSCRDKAAMGSAEGCGVTLSVRQSARRSGELEALSIEGKLSIADLVSPGLKDATAADKQRIKALLQLTGVKADATAFRELFPDDASFAAICTAEVLNCGDVVEMAAKIRKKLHDAARITESGAENEEGQAIGCQQAAEGVDMEAETDEALLQAALEDAISNRGKLQGEAARAVDSQERAAEARDKIERSAAPDVAGAENRRNEAQVALNGAQHEVDRLEKELATARSRLQEARAAFAEADHSLTQEKAHADTYAAWKESIEAAGNVSAPSEEELATATQAVADARKAIEKAALARTAIEKKHEADEHREAARNHRRKAVQLRDAAKATDDVLSRMVASDNLTVKSGRLITQHPERGEVFYAERSDGTRWKLAIDEAIKRIRQLGAEQTAIIPVPQAAWSELDPANKAAIHQYALEQNVTIITAEAADGELRAEAFAAEQEADDANV